MIFPLGSQEFYALNNNVMETARINLKLRYSLLKHYFMLFVRTDHAGTVFRPLFFEFSDDKGCFEDSVMDKQFLVGSELMSTPILEPGNIQITAYFPEGSWFDVMSGYRMSENNNSNAEGFTTRGTDKIVVNKLSDTVPLFIRGGKLIGWQDTTNVLNQK